MTSGFDSYRNVLVGEYAKVSTTRGAGCFDIETTFKVTLFLKLAMRMVGQVLDHAVLVIDVLAMVAGLFDFFLVFGGSIVRVGVGIICSLSGLTLTPTPLR